MSPGLRRAFHQALDLVLDALAEEERQAPAKKRRKIAAKPMPPLPPDTTPEEMAQAAALFERAGWRKSA